MATPRQILKNVFGYDSFRLNQEQIVSNVLSGRDTLAILPTGGGKSLCYQVPALLWPGLTVVMSPLISLMQDQIEQLRDVGINAVVLNSAIDSQEYRRNMARVARGDVRLLYVAPETVLQPRILDFLTSVNVSCIAIDEAHCISEWGHDFRPDYRQLGQVRARFSKAVCIALTATATPRVRDDIRNMLHFDSDDEFVSSFDRSNLQLDVTMRRNGLAQVIDVVDKYADRSGIVYCASRKQVERLAKQLRDHGVSAMAYHAGLDDTTRAKNQDAFRMDEVRVMVATVAFGMGINKPDVRFVIHYELPKNIESYYQQIGRAGRDGLDAYCLLLFAYADIAKIGFFIEQMAASERRQAQQHLQTLIDYCETAECRRIPLLAYFGETPKRDSCGRCDNCATSHLPPRDLTELAQKFMSCMFRTGQRFGAFYVVDVLRGSQAQRVRDAGHDTVSTWGIGRDVSRAEWLLVANVLLRHGVILQNEHGGLSLSKAAWPILKNEKRFLCRISPIAQDKLAREKRAQGGMRQSKKSSGKKTMHDRTLHNESVFESLRTLRLQLAREKRVPPYVIFSDRTLIEMANHRPMTDAALLEISGVGQAKLKKYGAAFLDVLSRVP